jgi:hypothetical protein
MVAVFGMVGVVSPTDTKVKDKIWDKNFGLGQVWDKITKVVPKVDQKWINLKPSRTKRFQRFGRKWKKKVDQICPSGNPHQ